MLGKGLYILLILHVTQLDEWGGKFVQTKTQTFRVEYFRYGAGDKIGKTGNGKQEYRNKLKGSEKCYIWERKKVCSEECDRSVWSQLADTAAELDAAQDFAEHLMNIFLSFLHPSPLFLMLVSTSFQVVTLLQKRGHLFFLYILNVPTGRRSSEQCKQQDNELCRSLTYTSFISKQFVRGHPITPLPVANRATCTPERFSQPWEFQAFGFLQNAHSDRVIYFKSERRHEGAKESTQGRKVIRSVFKQLHPS